MNAEITGEIAHIDGGQSPGPTSLSDYLSDNRHRHQRTHEDVHGRCEAGQMD